MDTKNRHQTGPGNSASHHSAWCTHWYPNCFSPHYNMDASPFLALPRLVAFVCVFLLVCQVGLFLSGLRPSSGTGAFCRNPGNSVHKRKESRAAVRCAPKKAKTEICMSTSPLPPASSSEPAPDVFERLLQCSGLLTAKELARIVNLSSKTLYSYAERDLIPHFRIETNVRFRGKDVADWLRQRRLYGNNHFPTAARWDVSFPSRARGKSHRASL
jgi:predicted DNA-binding transcriptional regulator AlpA